ncbi:MAG: tRNA (5-methylaminomethyl-2-thiouridine)(34)-methyltransferase MnmD [Bacteroidota bacterium]
MKREIIKTADGSHTISIPEWNEQYHSVNGAVAEAYHVFINAGLKEIDSEKISILEIGFGTGLNSIITMIEAQKLNKDIYYQGVEAYPVKDEEIKVLNYIDVLNAEEFRKSFEVMHSSKWDEEVVLNDSFTLLKQNKTFDKIEDVNKFDLIYFDAFGPDVQPDLWSEEIFAKMYKSLKSEGILVTYSAKGSVKRAMKSAGFRIERLPGPKGKREMTRAVKG